MNKVLLIIFFVIFGAIVLSVIAYVILDMKKQYDITTENVIDLCHNDELKEAINIYRTAISEFNYCDGDLFNSANAKLTYAKERLNAVSMSNKHK